MSRNLSQATRQPQAPLRRNIRSSLTNRRPSRTASAPMPVVTLRSFAIRIFRFDVLFGLRNAIARERGIAAYRAWVSLERIRPVSIPQEKWEETFAWPANNEPPYPPFAQRILREVVSYVVVVLIAAVLLQVFTPVPVLTWLAQLLTPNRRTILRERILSIAGAYFSMFCSCFSQKKRP
jgi:hypothetical protein